MKLDDKINREASDKTKGFRLQKIRMLELLLNEIQNNDTITVYGTIELHEDIYLQKNTNTASSTYLEENKNYQKDSSFTFNTPTVQNTLVSFLDCWINKWQFDSNLRLGFYSTNTIGKEKETDFIKNNSISLPNEPLLSIINSRVYLDDVIIDVLSKILINEFSNQYSIKNPKRIGIVQKLSSNEWRDFFNLIHWKFDMEDEKKLKSHVLELIKNSKFFSHKLMGKENRIFSELMELIEEKQFFENYSERFVFSSDVKLIFANANLENNTDKTEDPVWKQWTNLSPPETRNIKEKLVSVCAEYNNKKIGLKSIIASRGLGQKMEYEGDKTFLSLRYRVFEIAYKEILALNISGKIAESELDDSFNKVFQNVKNEIEVLKSSYKYNYCNDEIIEGIIHELFDSCFLAMD